MCAVGVKPEQRRALRSRSGLADVLDMGGLKSFISKWGRLEVGTEPDRRVVERPKACSRDQESAKITKTAQRSRLKGRITTGSWLFREPHNATAQLCRTVQFHFTLAYSACVLQD